MSGTRVPITPPQVLRQTATSTDIYSGRPVRAVQWQNMAGLVNYLNGHGGSLIVANSHGNGYNVLSASTDFYYYIHPRYRGMVRLWVATFRSDDQAYGTFSVNDVELGDWKVPNTSRESFTAYYWEEHAQSSTSTSKKVTIGVDGGTVYLDQVACYDVPRVRLANNLSDRGADTKSCGVHRKIYWNISAPVSVGGVTAGEEVARTNSRRNAIFDWCDPSGVQPDSNGNATFSPVFEVVNPEVLNRALYEDDGNGETNGRQVDVYVLAEAVGTTVAPNFKVTMTCGNTASITILTSLTWYGPIEIDVDCEDVTAASGLRGGTWEEMDFQAYQSVPGEGTYLKVYGISVGEAV